MARERPPRWWGHFKVSDGQTARWTVGPLKLYIGRLSHEWQIDSVRDALEQEQADRWDLTPEATPPAERKNMERFVFRRTHSPLVIKPVLLDRPVVSRPAVPLHILSGEEVTVFVSSPLCVRIAVHEPPVTLRDVPIQLLSDTWFGPSTREGELAYATRTSARINQDDLPLRITRAVTPVLVRNRAETALLVERLSLPVPFLSLYAAEDDSLWTESVVLDRESDTEMATLEIQETPPRQIRRASKIAEPRRAAEKGMLVRAFSAVFG